MFSEVVRKSDEAPQIITLYGREKAVVLSVENYRKLTSSGGNFVQFMENSPWAGVELELPRRESEPLREIDF